eukprot:TRINITY_DN12796_c0_g1_i1.p1 TRINITY_DN12796_c0_g1~~TRINITY_DN12796_c0_g1_i1.p1  ORF type:complete len:425 (+),score=86.84 TRINITY_DN12796_c0_g1_i1:58-1275(+)
MARTLESLAQAAKGKPSAFPFWLQQMKVPQDMLEVSHSLPLETFEAYPSIIRRSFSRKNEHPDVTRQLTARPHFQKYRKYAGDNGSRAPEIVGLIHRIRYFENHMMKIEDKDLQLLWKQRVIRMKYTLTGLRVENFPAYWRMMQDFKLWDIVRDRHDGFVSLGAFYHPGPESSTKVSNIDEYLDPETLYGCEETGESRYAVSRRKGKLYQSGTQVYAKDSLDGLWKLGEVLSTNADNQTCAISLLAVDEIIPEQSWDDMKPFDNYATARPMHASDPVRGELAEESSRFVYFENLKATDPVMHEQEWYQHICNKYYDGKAPTGSFRGWRQRFMHWDAQTTSHKRIRWVKGLSKYMQRRVYLGYPVRSEIFEGGASGKLEPWWVQSRPTFMPVKDAETGKKVFIVPT